MSIFKKLIELLKYEDDMTAREKKTVARFRVGLFNLGISVTAFFTALISLLIASVNLT